MGAEPLEPEATIRLDKDQARFVAAAVAAGRYASPAEVVRDALFLLQRVEAAAVPESQGVAQRFATSLRMFELGLELKAHKLRREDPGAPEAEIQRRLRVWLDGDSQAEAVAGHIVDAPARLERLRNAR